MDKANTFKISLKSADFHGLHNNRWRFLLSNSGNLNYLLKKQSKNVFVILKKAKWGPEKIKSVISNDLPPSPMHRWKCPVLNGTFGVFNDLLRGIIFIRKYCSMHSVQSSPKSHPKITRIIYIYLVKFITYW